MTVLKGIIPKEDTLLLGGYPVKIFEEPRRGKWKPFDLTWGRSVWACDACGETVDVPTLNGKPIFDYCPWCGAKMNDEEQKGVIK